MKPTATRHWPRAQFVVVAKPGGPGTTYPPPPLRSRSYRPPCCVASGGSTPEWLIWAPSAIPASDNSWAHTRQAGRPVRDRITLSDWRWPAASAQVSAYGRQADRQSGGRAAPERG